MGKVFRNDKGEAISLSYESTGMVVASLKRGKHWEVFANFLRAGDAIRLLNLKG